MNEHVFLILSQKKIMISVKRRLQTIVFTMQMSTWQQQSHYFLTHISRQSAFYTAPKIIFGVVI